MASYFRQFQRQFPGDDEHLLDASKSRRTQALGWISCAQLANALIYLLAVSLGQTATPAAADSAAKHCEATYSRLMSGPFKGHDEQALVQLAERMRDTEENRGGRERTGHLPLSGLVYFGQFIDHDVTRDETAIDDAAKPPEKRTNCRTPLLDLDSLYGDGPSKGSNLYDDRFPLEQARLRVGPTEGGKNPDTNEEVPPTMDDLPRLGGVTVLGDDRNDENLILAQLHVAFLQFHNRVLECFLNDAIPKPEQYGTTPFERTRRFVTWHYQYLVLNEFLHRMVLNEVWDKRDDLSWRLFRPKTGNVALPVEFTQAAFRFGHSMVQNEYTLQGRGRKPLVALFLKTPPGTPSPKLKPDEVIDWSLFLNENSGPANIAQNIDTLIEDAMYHLPPASFAVFLGAKSVHVNLPLPAITLLRGSRLGLPTGQEACAAYRISPLPADKIGFNEATRRFLEDHDMLKRAPLWYYILREAEVLGAKTEEHRENGLGGECLGPLGSRLVADVLLGVLNADPDSYVVKDPKWSPPEFSCPVAGKKWQLTTLERLVMFAKTRSK
jgi:hypothetical protein